MFRQLNVGDSIFLGDLILFSYLNRLPSFNFLLHSETLPDTYGNLLKSANLTKALFSNNIPNFLYNIFGWFLRSYGRERPKLLRGGNIHRSPFHKSRILTIRRRCPLTVRLFENQIGRVRSAFWYLLVGELVGLLQNWSELAFEFVSVVVHAVTLQFEFGDLRLGRFVWALGNAGGGRGFCLWGPVHHVVLQLRFEFV